MFIIRQQLSILISGLNATGSCFQASHFLSLKFSLPRQLFTLSKPLVNCKQIACPCYLFHWPSLIPAASSAAMTKVHRHCMQVIRFSPTDCRALSGNSPTALNPPGCVKSAKSSGFDSTLRYV